MRSGLAGIATLALLAAACPPLDDDDSTAPESPIGDDDDAVDDDDATLEPTWESLHPLFLFRCACHRTNEGGDGGLTGMESVELAYVNLVGRPSDDVPGLDRVDPGRPDSSYALLKILDQHRSVGGPGDRMPPTGVALREDQVAVIREWIEDGAPLD